MKQTNRNEYQKMYQTKWRKKNQLRFLETQVKYWTKKLNECKEGIESDD